MDSSAKLILPRSTQSGRGKAKGEEYRLKSSLSSVSHSKRKRCLSVICSPRGSGIWQFIVYKLAAALFHNTKWRFNLCQLISTEDCIPLKPWVKERSPGCWLASLTPVCLVQGPWYSAGCVLSPLNQCLPSTKRKHFFKAFAETLLYWGLKWELLTLQGNTVSGVTPPSGSDSGWRQLTYVMFDILWVTHSLPLKFSV